MSPNIKKLSKIVLIIVLLVLAYGFVDARAYRAGRATCAEKIIMQ